MTRPRPGRKNAKPQGGPAGRKPTVAGRKKPAGSGTQSPATATPPESAPADDFVPSQLDPTLDDRADTASADGEVADVETTGGEVTEAAPTEADATATEAESTDRETVETADAGTGATEAGAATETGQAETGATDDKPRGKPRRPVTRVSTIKAGAAAPTPSGQAAGSRAGAAGRRRDGSLASRVVTARNAVRVVLTAVVIGLIALILAFTPGARIGANKAFIDQVGTSELTSQARSKLCLPIAVTSQDFDQWAGQARAILVDTALKNFNDYLPTQKKLIEQSKLVADCKIDSVGVRDMSGSADGATATVIANILVSQSLQGQLLNSASVRVSYGMKKFGDQWLISSVDPF